MPTSFAVTYGGYNIPLITPDGLMKLNSSYDALNIFQKYTGFIVPLPKQYLKSYTGLLPVSTQNYKYDNDQLTQKKNCL